MAVSDLCHLPVIYSPNVEKSNTPLLHWPLAL